MPTKLIRFLYNISSQHQGCVVAIGNFDGVHLGHQSLISKTIEKAKSLGVPSIVITFEPHAFEFFGGDNVTIPRLTRFREKFYALAQTGVDYVLILKFNQELASLSASDFLKRLNTALKPVYMIVGDDFRFGYKRQGDFNLLVEMGKELGFGAESLPAVTLDNERISSTRIRKALKEGNHTLAKRLLGHAYTMMGRVRSGDKLGRQLGFPTANIYLHRQLTPVHGVYFVLVYGIGNQVLRGAANVGSRPTVDGTRTLLEVHLLDFNQDIYGHYVKIEFCYKFREELRFPNLDLLKEQIAKDVMAARNYFEKYQ